MSQLSKPNSQPESSLGKLISSDSAKKQFAAALPKMVPAETFVRAVMTCLNKTPKLLNCTQTSVTSSLLTLAQLGLLPDGRNAHLIPYGTECQLIIDYKGYVELVMRSGMVSRIHADKVCENDVFNVNLGEITEHKIDYRKDRGPAYAYYVVVTMKDGGTKTEIMSKADVDAVRKRSKAGSSGPWVTDYDEMAKKTVFRRCQKWLPISAELRSALDADDDRIVETTATPVVQSTADQLLSLLPEPTVDVTPEPVIETPVEEKPAAASKKLEPGSSAWFIDQIRKCDNEPDLLSLRQELTEAYKVNKALFPIEAELDAKLAEVRAKAKGGAK